MWITLKIYRCIHKKTAKKKEKKVFHLFYNKMCIISFALQKRAQAGRTKFYNK